MTDEKRQLLSIDDILGQCMDKLDVDTPDEMLRAVFDITDRLAAIEATPTPLLTVGEDKVVHFRHDLSVRGLVGIIETLEHIPLAGMK